MNTGKLIFLLLSLIVVCGCKNPPSQLDINITELNQSKDFELKGYAIFTVKISIHVSSYSTHNYKLCLFGKDSIPKGRCDYHFQIPAGQVDTVVWEEWYSDYTKIRYLPSSGSASGSINMKVKFNHEWK